MNNEMKQQYLRDKTLDFIRNRNLTEATLYSLTGIEFYRLANWLVGRRTFTDEELEVMASGLLYYEVLYLLKEEE